MEEPKQVVSLINMGRYAFFSTEYEYKFWFAIQPSEDILKFGGTKIAPLKHQWTKDDLPYIHAKLLICAKDNRLTLPDFETYQKNIDGTHALATEIDTSGDGPGEEHAFFYLGCILYHQLLWNDTLTARYEP